MHAKVTVRDTFNLIDEILTLLLHITASKSDFANGLKKEQFAIINSCSSKEYLSPFYRLTPNVKKIYTGAESYKLDPIMKFLLKINPTFGN